MALRKMAVSVATGRVSAVFLEDGAVVGVKRLRLETKTTQNAARIIGTWIRGFGPDHMITEDPKTALRKNTRTKAVIEAIATIMSDSEGLDIRLSRVQSYQMTQPLDPGHLDGESVPVSFL